MIRDQLSSVTSHGGQGSVIPALFTKMSMGPRDSRTAVAAASTARGSPMSTGRSAPESHTATWAPSAWNRSTIARPSPRAPPVTTATRPSSAPIQPISPSS